MGLLVLQNLEGVDFHLMKGRKSFPEMQRKRKREK